MNRESDTRLSSVSSVFFVSSVSFVLILTLLAVTACGGGGGGGGGAPAPELSALVKDIHTGSPTVSDSHPREFVELGGWIFFAAETREHGHELWKTPGPSGTATLVKDILPGSAGSYPHELVVLDDRLFFSANGRDGGHELWSSDGTADGTVRVKDIWPGCLGSFPTRLTPWGNLLLFSAETPAGGRELFKTDGTEAGTVMVADLYPGLDSTGNANGSNPDELVVLGSRLYFAATTEKQGRELFRTDGNGVELVRDIYTGNRSASPREVVAMGNRLYFRAADSTGGSELWKSDGTRAGTTRVADIRAGSLSSSPRGLTVMGATLFFSASDNKSGTELWKSDGSASGTVPVKDIYSGSSGSHPAYLTVAGSALFFHARDASHGYEPWVLDARGARLLKDIRPGLDSSSPSHFTAHPRGGVVFVADDGQNGREPWRSDGTENGTTLLKDIHPGKDPGGRPNSSSPSSLRAVGNAVWFRAENETVGNEPWHTDGTGAGTRLFRNLNAETGGSSRPRDMVEFGGLVYFAADSGDGANGHGAELWRTDGTAAGTAMFLDIQAGPGSSRPSRLTVVGDTLFFVADDGRSGRELWKTDGTVAGTTLVTDLYPGSNRGGRPYSSSPYELTPIGNQLFFVGYNGTVGREVFKSDGTARGTVVVADLEPGFDSYSVSDLTPMGDTLYFVTYTRKTSYAIWKSDGTRAGTTPLDLGSGRNPASLAAVGNQLFFSAYRPDTGYELWSSDGTAQGTKLVKDIWGGKDSSNPRYLQGAGSTLFFVAATEASGHELWKSDGTEAGTVLVKDIFAGGGGRHQTRPRALTALDDKVVLFWAVDEATGLEPWRSDGTAGGTFRLADTYAGCHVEGEKQELAFRVSGGVAWFGALTAAHGVELWRTDGTVAGTRMVSDSAPGPADGLDHLDVARIGARLLFSGMDGAHGDELRSVSVR